MNVKSLAHSIQLSLHSATGLNVKRSHVHEMIAAAFGCGSHAAMLAVGVLCPMPSALAQRQRLDGPGISHRAVELEYPQSATAAIEKVVLAAIKQDDLRLLSLDLVLRLLLRGQLELNAWELEAEVEEFGARESIDEADDTEDLDEEDWNARQREEDFDELDLTSESVISALTHASERADGRAHLALSLLFAGNLDDLDSSGSGDGRYWHDREQKGHALGGVEKEWADGYRLRVDAKQRAEVHLAAAANLQQPDALLLMAEKYAAPRFFEIAHPKVHADPAFVSQLADHLGYTTAAIVWLESAAELGDMGAMRALIRERQFTDPLKCWTWYHLAKLHGKDLTRDDYRAIHEDGTSYDDDVGGTVFAVGEDGVELPAAEESIRQLAEARANEIFSR